MKLKTYETKRVFLVQDQKTGVIYKIFGIESAADDYVKKLADKNIVKNEWPVEFEVN